MRNCKRCGAEFFWERKQGIKGGNKPRIYCSRTCQSRDATVRKRQRYDISNPKPVRACDFCGKDYGSRIKAQRFCSEACRMGEISSTASARWREAHPFRESYEYKCTDCGVDVVKRLPVSGAAAKYGVFCDACSVERTRVRNRSKNVKRRGYRAISRISAVELAEKFGNVCHLCNQVIDVSLPRTSKYGLTVDHILPLALGGSDDDSNLGVAHWICNSVKGAKVNA